MEYSGRKNLIAHRKSGVSLAIVVCVAAFFVAFSAAILHTAAVLLAESNERLEQERVYQLARTFSEALSEDLTQYTNREEEDGDTHAGTFYAFANEFLDEEMFNDATSYTYVADTVTNLDEIYNTTEDYGNIAITLLKTPQYEASTFEEAKTGTIAATAGATGYGAAITEIKNRELMLYTLTVDVTAYLNGISYTYSTEFERTEKYEIESFTDNAGAQISWNGASWVYGTTAGTEDCENPGTITYKYGNAIESIFKEVTYNDTDEEQTP